MSVSYFTVIHTSDPCMEGVPSVQTVDEINKWLGHSSQTQTVLHTDEDGTEWRIDSGIYPRSLEHSYWIYRHVEDLIWSYEYWAGMEEED
jgi:hypothetical protein